MLSPSRPSAAAIAGHPGARALAGAGEHVAVEEADVVAVAVGDPPGADVRVEDRDLAGISVKLEAVELPGHVEHAVDHVVELEVGLDLVLREVVAVLADLLHVVAIVPRLDRDVLAEPAGDRLLVGDLLAHARDRGRPDPHHQRLRALGRARHRVLHAPVGVAGEAEQPGAVGADAHDLGDDRVGVVGIAIVAAVDERAPDPLAQRAIVGEGQHRIDRRAGVDDGELAGRKVALARRRGGGGPDVGGDAGEVGLGGDDAGRLVGEQLLAELGEQAAPAPGCRR